MQADLSSRWRFGANLSLGLGGAVTLAGAFLLMLWLVGSWAPVPLVGSLIFLFAVLEIVTGGVLGHEHGAGIAFILSGVTCLLFLGFAGALAILSPLATSGPAVAMLLAIYLFVDAVLRALDLFLDHPRSWVPEAISTAAAPIFAIYLLATRQHVTWMTIAFIVGADFLLSGIAMVGSAVQLRQHPELDGYSVTDPAFVQH